MKRIAPTESLICDSFKNILLIQLGDIGDVVLTTPTIRAIKEAYPGTRLSILVFKPYGSLLAADPNIHEIVETARVRGPLLVRLREFWNFAIFLRRKHYDMAIDLRTGDRGAILSFLTGATVRVGRKGASNQFWHGILFTDILRDITEAPPPTHPGADQSLRVVRKLGIDTENSLPQLHIAISDKMHAAGLLSELGVTPGEFATINPFSRWKYKEWNNDKWGKVIDQLWERYHLPTLLIGAPEEAQSCEQIIRGREQYALNLAGKTTLGELAAVISMSTLHLGVDSAAPHIAAALGISTVTVHGPTDWRAWRIVNDNHKVVSAAMDCLPCSNTGCMGCGQSKCLDELPEPPVIHAACELIDAKRKN